MALNVNNIDYAGKELAIEIIRDSFSDSLFHTKFGARIVPSVKGKYFYWDASLDLTINCDNPVCPTFNTNFDLTQNNGELCKYHVAGSINHDAILNTARERFYKDGVLNEKVQDDTQLFDTLILMLNEAVAKEQDANFITADAQYDCCDGLLIQFEDGALNRPVPAGQLLTAVAISPSNVQVELSKVINALPSKFRYGRSKLARPKIAVSANILDAYWESLTYQAPTGAAGGNGVNIVEDGMARYRGYDLVLVDSLPDDTMFMTPPDNILMVMDDDADMTNLYIRNGLDDSTLCRKINFRLDWRAAIFFGDGEAVVYYR